MTAMDPRPTAGSTGGASTDLGAEPDRRNVTADLDGLPTATGFRLRPWRGLDADLPLMWAASDAARVADGEVDRNSLEGMSAYYRHLERYDPAADLVIAETEDDGRFAGYSRVEWNDSNDGERWYEGVCIVDPEFRRRGIGRVLLAWSERRRLEIAAEHAGGPHATDRVRALTTFIFDGDSGGKVLLDGAGYTPFRRFASMRRPDLDDLPEVSLPAGLEVRPIARETAAMRQVFDADVEAFKDHFGWTDGGDEKFAEFIEAPEVDPALWVVAFDGDQVAGAVTNGIHVSPDGERSGWLDSVFTRRPWRQRGLARALIARSLVVLRDRGLTAASLGVDLTNPNQALALYESCGFRKVSGATSYRKPLPNVPADSPEEPAR
jgi:mycothiol synthase